MSRRLLTSAEVADLLRVGREGFLRMRRRLEQCGFPAPLDMPGIGHRWDPKAIDDWLDRKRQPPDPLAFGCDPAGERSGKAGHIVIVDAEGRQDDEMAGRLRRRAAELAGR